MFTFNTVTFIASIEGGKGGLSITFHTVSQKSSFTYHQHYSLFIDLYLTRSFRKTCPFRPLTYIHLDCQLGFEKRYQRWPKYEGVCS